MFGDDLDLLVHICWSINQVRNMSPKSNWFPIVIIHTFQPNRRSSSKLIVFGVKRPHYLFVVVAVVIFAVAVVVAVVVALTEWALLLMLTLFCSRATDVQRPWLRFPNFVKISRDQQWNAPKPKHFPIDPRSIQAPNIPIKWPLTND